MLKFSKNVFFEIFFLKENKEFDGIFLEYILFRKWNSHNYLFIYLTNICQSGQHSMEVGGVFFFLFG